MDEFKLYINEREAASFLGLSPRTLQKHRITGLGPIFHKLGRSVRYTISDLKTWAESKSRKSTSDLGRELG
jgi:hypothetical protein